MIALAIIHLSLIACDTGPVDQIATPEKDCAPTLCKYLPEPTVIGKDINGFREVWLFSGVSHLVWRILDNFERNPQALDRISGIQVLVYPHGVGQDSGIEELPDVRNRLHDLGLEFMVGLRHGAATPGDMDGYFDPEQNQKIVDYINRLHVDKVCVDAEPYFYEGLRYHGDADMARITLASTPWKNLKVKELWLAPCGPHYNANQAIAMAAASAGVDVYVMDEITYNAADKLKEDPARFREHLLGMKEWCEVRGLHYAPGVYIANADEPQVLAEILSAGIDVIWYFGSVKPAQDDKYNFGSPTWSPGRYRKLHAPSGQKLIAQECISGPGVEASTECQLFDCDGDGDVDLRDVVEVMP